MKSQEYKDLEKRITSNEKDIAYVIINKLDRTKAYDTVLSELCAESIIKLQKIFMENVEMYKNPEFIKNVISEINKVQLKSKSCLPLIEVESTTGTKKSISDEIEKAIREFIVKRPYKSPEYLILSQEQYIDLLNEIKTDKELYYYHGLFVCIFKSDIKKSIKVA